MFFKVFFYFNISKKYFFNISILKWLKNTKKILIGNILKRNSKFWK